jgi:hypothetical protein
LLKSKESKLEIGQAWPSAVGKTAREATVATAVIFFEGACEREGS